MKHANRFSDALSTSAALFLAVGLGLGAAQLVDRLRTPAPAEPPHELTTVTMGGPGGGGGSIDIPGGGSGMAGFVVIGGGGAGRCDGCPTYDGGVTAKAAERPWSPFQPWGYKCRGVCGGVDWANEYEVRESGDEYNGTSEIRQKTWWMKLLNYTPHP